MDTSVRGQYIECAWLLLVGLILIVLLPVSRGWVMADGANGPVQDWLFTGKIPAPGSVAMLALGGLVASRRRR